MLFDNDIDDIDGNDNGDDGASKRGNWNAIDHDDNGDDDINNDDIDGSY